MWVRDCYLVLLTKKYELEIPSLSSSLHHSAINMMCHLLLNPSSVPLNFIGHLHQFSLDTMHCSLIFGCQSHLLLQPAFVLHFLAYLLSSFLLILGFFLASQSRHNFIHLHIFHFPSLSTFSLILPSPVCFLSSSEEVLVVNSHHSSSWLQLISGQSFPVSHTISLRFVCQMPYKYCAQQLFLNFL